MENRHTSRLGPAIIKAGIRKPKPNSKPATSKVQTKITDFIKPKTQEQVKPYSRIDINNVRFKQLINNRREPSMDEINRLCVTATQFVCFGHEPNSRLGAPVGLNKKHTKVHSLEGNPRAYIFASSNLHIWPIPSLTNGDVATALFDTHDPKVGKLVLCSFYWDILEKEIPAAYLKVAEFARSNGFILITGSDTNAHSTLWNCAKDNTRGKKLEEMMIKADLVPVNRGNKWTFQGGMGNSIIDVTMVTSRFANRIKDWRVSNRNTFSDHNLIEFEVDIEPPQKYQYIDYKYGNHDKFRKDWEEQAALLALELMHEDKRISLIEKRCNRITEIIQNTSKKYYKVKEVIVRPDHGKWITKEIREQIDINN